MGLILVASRDTAEIETIKAALSVHGWWVTVAPDRETALQAAADQAPKLVLVDHELPESIELIRGFGASNGGPGVLACVPDGFDGALELKEAGVDELITKPLSPPGLLEVVRRCLSAPRRAEPERPASTTKSLLTTEEIFGDVLRELGEEPAPAAEPEPAAPPSVVAPAPQMPMPETTAPAAPAAAAAAELFDSAPAAKPVVSLAGLFDDDEISATPAPEAVEVAAPAPEADWDGEERRGPDRPWDPSQEGGSRPALDELFASASVELEDAVDPEPASEVPATAAAEVSEADDLDTVEAPAVSKAAVEALPVEEPEVEAQSTGRPARRVPAFALAIGGLAAALLVIAGVVFFRNSGSETATTPIRAGEPVEASSDVVPAESVGSTDSVEPEGSDAPQDGITERQTPPVAETSAAPAPAAGDPIEEIDLEAIVAEELTRREEELRQVFLEEEKRLLRELNKLDETSPPAEDGAEDESDSGR